MELKVKLLSDKATMPSFAHEGDACLDLYSAKTMELPCNMVIKVPTDIALGIPEGYEGLVRPRSGLAYRKGITVKNAPGTLDCTYRGHVQVLLFRQGCGDNSCCKCCDEAMYKIRKGDRIAQLAIREVPKVVPIEVSELDDTDRGANGFGSTGK